MPATLAVDPGESQPIMAAGRWIIYVMNSTVRAADVLTGKAHVLGKALAFAPSAGRGNIWLEYGNYQSGAAAVTVRSVPVAGGPPGPLIALPRGTQLVAGTDAGLLLEPRGGEVGGPFWLWAPGIAPRRLPYSSSAETRATAVPSSAAFLLSVTAWSARSSWLFYQGPGRHMWAYQVTTGRVRSSRATCCQYAVMATISSPPG